MNTNNISRSSFLQWALMVPELRACPSVGGMYRSCTIQPGIACHSGQLALFALHLHAFFKYISIISVHLHAVSMPGTCAVWRVQEILTFRCRNP